MARPTAAPPSLRTPFAGGVSLLAGSLGLMVAFPSGLRAQAGRPVPPHRPDRVLVAFHPAAGLAARTSAVAALGLKVDYSFRSDHVARVQIPPTLRAQGATVEDALAALRRDPTVRVAEPDYVVQTALTPTDPDYSSLWGLHNNGQTGGTADADIDAPEAWDQTTGTGNVVVAVIDSGVDYDHPDLRDNIMKDANGAVVGYDYANNDADPMDDNNHGTHCAGTIGARMNNGVGVVGVCPRVKIMPLKFLAADGSGSISGAIQCVDFARLNGAKIMNNSWGGGGYSQLLYEAIQRARDAGILFLAAAGNGGADGVGDNNDGAAFYPANYDLSNVVSVAASNHSDTLGSFSNYGLTTVDLAAPGVDILSTVPGNGYSSFDGTSMATPHVAGAAALVLSRTPSLTMTQLRDRLLNSVDKLTALNGKVVTGGRLNVNKALGTVATGDAYEADDSAAAAKAITSGQTQSRSIHVAGNIDWVKFTLALPSNVAVETAGAAGDTEMWLYGPNSASTQQGYNNDVSTTNRFSRIALNNLAAGTYYLRVQEFQNNAAIASYTLRLTATATGGADSFEPDDSATAAKAIAGGQTQTRSIHAAGNVDWVKLVLTTPSRVVLETAGAAGDTEMWLYGPNSSTAQLAYNDNRSTSSLFSLISRSGMAAGTYYVKVQEKGNDATLPSYTLKATVTAGDAYEADNTAATAKTIGNGQTQSRSIHAASDVDWVKFTITATSNVTVETFGTAGDTELTVYGPNNSVDEIDYNDDKDAGGFFSRVDMVGLAPGTYYVLVNAWNNAEPINAYTLKLTVTPQ